MKDQYDDKSGYCRILGHTLGFNYCRIMQEGLPCHNILNCWFERFPVETFLEENYSSEEQKAILHPPRTRMDALAAALNKKTEDDDSGT